MAFNISCSSDVFLKKKRARYYLVVNHMLQILCSSVRVKFPGFWCIVEKQNHKCCVSQVTLEALNFFMKIMETKGFFSI